VKKKIITDINYIRQKSEEVKREELNSIVQDLKDSFDEKRAIGLTAIQIGIPKKVSIFKLPNQEDFTVIYNVEIIEKTEPFRTIEGCLSIPGLRIETRRYKNVVWINGDGQKYSSDGIEAIVIQHEVDHQNGKIILERKWKNPNRRKR
jgi:peptide deformylase